MPKRGGGNGGQRYNNNNAGNGGGSGGSRYSALKDFDEIEDHQRQKDRNKRRVSFKPSNLVNRDVQLRLNDVRRWHDDEDMGDTTSSAKDRPRFRRRGSPRPRAKFAVNDRFGKLTPNPYGWYQVTIHNGQIYDKDTIIRSLLAAMSPHVFIPQHWRAERHCVIFFTDSFEVAENIQSLGRNAQLPDGFRLNPRVRHGIPLVTIDDAIKERMKVTMGKRYNIQTKALDLSRFHADPELKSIFCPLFRANVMSTALDIIYENIPDVEAINLNENNISSMEAFKAVDKRLPHLKILYLGDNKLPSLAHLLVFRNLPIEELVLRNNPCRNRYKDPQHFVSEVRRKFPKLVKLDGETFDLSASTLPAAKASFLCDSAGATMVREFLDQYFNIFDSNNRQPLLDAYHEQAMLSISMPSASQAGRLEHYWKFNRNLRRMANNDREDSRTRLLKTGRLACVSTLDEWPRTLHERRTFTVDLTIYNPLMSVFTVTGLFKELSGEANSAVAPNLQSYELRHFMRTFVVVPQNNGFCIRNETIFITSATPDQLREFKRAQHQPAPATLLASPSASTSMTTGDLTLQNRLQLSQPAVVGILPAPTAPVATVPTAAAGTLDDVTKMQMVQTMSAQSQMNLDWSRKCLEETNWDFNHAAFVFEKLFKENKIPPEAFVK